MNAMFVITASSCGVWQSGSMVTAPTVPWMVSSRVKPVKTRMVVSFSFSVSVFQLGMSLETGTFSGSQKLPVSRSQTSRSLSSGMVFQLMALTGLFGSFGAVPVAMGIPHSVGVFRLKLSMQYVMQEMPSSAIQPNCSLPI